MKKFWKRTEGFTLVELVVVIAILGVLAGVGTVGYSGYVKKANMAADQQLLSYVNQAFAVACIENGEDSKKVIAENIELADGVITAAEFVVTSPSAKADEIEEAFFKYFKGNENSEFKVFERLDFDQANGVFKENTDSLLASVVRDILNNPDYADEIAAIKGSSLGKAGAANLAGQYDTIGGHAGMAIGLGIERILIDGEDYENIKDNTFATLVLSDEYLATLGMTKDDVFDMAINEGNAVAADFLANSLVMSAAQGAAGKDAVYVTNLISDTSVSALKEKLKNSETAQAALADTALIYGVYTSYLYATDEANAPEKLANLKSSKDLTEALDVMNSDSNFATYMSEGKGQSDIDAYLDALDMISDATADKAVKDEVLKNGFADDQMMELLVGLLGK